jgi:hypothetical protein
MYVENKIMYHVHKNRFHTELWNVGNTINFDGETKNEFMRFYDYQHFSINNPILGNKYLVDYMKKVSKHKNFVQGENVILPINAFLRLTKGYSYSCGFIAEIIFEQVRNEIFSNCPSRFNCMWLCEENDIPHWKSQFESESSVYKVRVTGKLHIADSSVLPGDTLSHDEIRKIAYDYWNGIIKRDSSREMLFYGKVEIVEKIE